MKAGEIVAGIAILGFGTVGEGVYEVLAENEDIITRRAEEPVVVRRVLDRRDDFKHAEVTRMATRDIADIINDGGIDVAVECMGGAGAAYEYTKALLSAGKSVVTSNKELVSKKGAELVKIAVEKGVNYMYEAAVTGAIPIVRAINRCLTGDRLLSVSGIFNGTTNYILTEMTERGKGYAEALKEAQDKRYAEFDPSYDVDGLDAAFKLSILLSLITGRKADHEDIYAEGIRHITENDIKTAERRGSVIKLIARGDIFADGSVRAYVCPMFVSNRDPLSVVRGANNAVTVTGSASGDLTFSGMGAGKRPTASAVAADVIEAVRHHSRRVASVSRGWSEERAVVKPFDDSVFEKVNGIRILT